ncbi:MAG: hypothetical protein A2Y10_18430 [Planctomycetes bacterium GWF2_41_51]|nr:MAG: hypothetical protein A2Y10_18430 [Planctomycetes bacterium GWF2_41_51]HBG26670.1 hypothetical protein [Phycisphaerales bacterium]
MHDFIKRIEEVIPLNAELLRNNNFFELYPYDGGGAYIHNQIVETINDAEIANKIINQNILAEWGGLADLDFTKFERWRSIEQSCWLTRFYFAASLSRHCWKTGDSQISKLIEKIILDFIRKYPSPKGIEQIERHLNRISNIRKEYNRRTFEENLRDDTEVPYMWYDFQPASRFLHILYCLYFLKDIGEFSDSQLHEICQSLYEHAELIWIEESNFLKLQKSSNHQSLRGLILLYAALLFKNYGKWNEFFEMGSKICDFHIENDFCDDGTLAENSPSYHCFETWHMRDAELLLRKLCPEFAEKFREKLAKAVSFIEKIKQPDGCTPVINDGYALYLDPFLKSLKGYKCSDKFPKAVLFKDAKIAVYKDDKSYLLFDASKFTGEQSHYHSGKNAVSYWFNNKPFFIDSGCCNYDDNLFADWYKCPQAHSSLLINGQGDGKAIGVYNWKNYSSADCHDWQENENNYTILSQLTSNMPEWKNVTWGRELSIWSDCLVITDMIEKADGKELCFIFNLHPDVKVESSNHYYLLDNEKTRLRLDFDIYNGSESGIIFNHGRCFVDFGHRQNIQILINVKAKGYFKMKTTFCNREQNN